MIKPGKTPFWLFLFPVFTTVISLSYSCTRATEITRPNMLFCIADDWGWPHAGVYGDLVVQTPNFDRLAKQGLLFENAFISSPSCTPSRNAIFTGQHFWRLGEGANLWSTLDATHPVYPHLLNEAGYHIGSWRKSFGPGDLGAGGYDSLRPGGPKYSGFRDFLEARPTGKPFSFWLGASDPHRPYEKGSGVASGIDLDQVEVPSFLPDAPEIRSDIADYYFEVRRFDSDVGEAIRLLDSLGELENTIIVVTGDHGMPFPRCKANLYDMGVRVPLVLYWGKNVKQPGKTVEEIVNLTDLAPTFLDAAGVEVPEVMSGRSLLPWITGEHPEPRDFTVFGRERHTPAQEAPSMSGYPSRAIRTHDYLYIRNLYPQDRWPVGVAEGATHPMDTFADCDNGPSKSFLVEHRDDPAYASHFQWCFGKRPAEELYLISEDPYQLDNLAEDPAFEEVRAKLSGKLEEELTATGDPRFTEEDAHFDAYPYRARYKLNTGEE